MYNFEQKSVAIIHEFLPRIRHREEGKEKTGEKYIYSLYICMCVCVDRERERKREGERNDE